MKKKSLKENILIRKKTWLTKTLYAKVTAIGEKNVLIKYSKNALYGPGEEKNIHYLKYYQKNNKLKSLIRNFK